MRTSSLLCLKKVTGPRVGSALNNPRSLKAKQRAAIALGEQKARLQESWLLPEDAPKGSKAARSKATRTFHYSMKVGQDVADEARSMSDTEWESVPLSKKHAFTKYISKMLKDNPTMVTEQQRRRYFETTMADPTELNPHKTVKDLYERIKMGLPVELDDPQRQLGVSQAMFEAADASMFDANNAHVIENAMTQLKQVFVDYVRKKKQGVSTDAERRTLAALSTELNHQTQQHLANTFKYADAKIQEAVKKEREQQLVHMHAIAEALKDGSRREGRKIRASRKQMVQDLMRNAYGLDAAVASTILKNLRAQENFLELCEVMLRLTLGKGFYHTEKDESLDAYIQNLKNLYSVNPEKLSSLDIVQFMAAREHVKPVDWAKRWYESALLLPLQETEEYKALKRIQDEEEAKAKVLLESEKGSPISISLEATATSAAAGAQKQQDKENEDADASSQKQQQETDNNNEPSGELVVTRDIVAAAEKQRQEVVHLVDKMFLDPNDKRLAAVHEKRLRFLVFKQLEGQIKRAREHATKFEGVELLPEAERCRELYAKLMDRRKELLSSGSASDMSSVSSSSTQDVIMTGQNNVFEDAEMQRIFSEIRDIAKSTIKALNVKNAADVKAQQFERILRILKGAPPSMDDQRDESPLESPAERAKSLLDEKKKATMKRILGLVERDVKEDVEWLEAMAEEDRPPLLPIPEPMSYVSAQDVLAWKQVADEQAVDAGNPFKKNKSPLPSFMGTPWKVPNKPLMFWGTGMTALQQGLRHAAEDAERRRRGEPLAPPYPCPENPWGWRLVDDVLDEPFEQQ